MEEKTLKILEYDKILAKVADHAGSTLGRELCFGLRPSANFRRIETWQQNTAHALKRIIDAGRVVSFSGVKDLSKVTARLKIEAILNTRELLDISELLQTTKEVKSYGQDGEKEKEADSISEYFSMLNPLPDLKTAIAKAIIDEDTIADDASPLLFSIRRKMGRIEGEIHNAINLKLNTFRDYLTERVITQKDGKMCLAVKAEYKSKVPGIVRDVSSTGITLFIEPMALVELDNTYSECEALEKREIEKVLKNLSEKATPYMDILTDNVKILSKLDMIFAKALYANELGSVKPKFSRDLSINFISARHPLIKKEKVVPIDMKLGDGYRLLIITGPNTGGKTVSLKTTGLLTLMAQSGLHIPVKEGSTAGIFKNVYADIGDEQSIEQSLSTFSSHMTNTVQILKKADNASLCLFDELGSGTDPTEGAALGIAILEFLRKLGASSLVTTHYAEIKVYALETSGVKNASCEFDVETLSPTYRLLLGIPGKSNAFEISKRLGLDSYIIEDARKRLSAENESFENVVAKLNEERLKTQKEKEEADIYLNEIKTLRTKLKEREESLKRNRDKILDEAKYKAGKILKDAKNTADTALKNIDKYKSSGDFIKMQKEQDRLKSKLREFNTTKEGMVQKGPSKPVSPRKLKKGTLVRVMPMGGAVGNVISLPDKDNNIIVQLGFMTTRVSVKDVELSEEPSRSQTDIVNNHGVSEGPGPKAKTISPEINLIGMTTDEARPLLEKYLDDAYLAHLKAVRIVHGRGTGALKNMTHELLRRIKYVDSFRLGVHGEGDSGVTIARFKE